MAPPSISESQKAPGNKTDRTRSLFYSVVAIVVIGSGGVALWMQYASARSMPLASGAASSSVIATGLKTPVTHKLDPEFTDVNGDLVADVPSDPAKWIDPPKLFIQLHCRR